MNSTHTVVDVCSCKKICTKTQPLRSDNAASTLKGSSEGQIQARLAPRKITERVTCSQSSYTVRARRRSFDSTATNKPRQYRGHAEEEPTTATIATLPTLLPHHCFHRSLIITLPPSVPLTDVELRYDAPKREDDTKVSPSSDHKIKGFPRRGQKAGSVWKGCDNNTSMPPRRSTTTRSRRHRRSRHEGTTGVFTRASTPPPTHIMSPRNQQTHQPPLPP